MAAGEQVPLEPSLALMLAQHLHDPAFQGRGTRRCPAFGRPTGGRWPRTRHSSGWRAFRRGRTPEIAWLPVEPGHVAQEHAELVGVGRVNANPATARPPRRLRKSGMTRSRSRMPPLAWGFAPMRRSPFGASSASPGLRRPRLVEQLLGPVAPEPVFQQLEVFGMRGIHGQRHLVRAKRALDLHAIHPLRPRPSLRRLEDDHRPTRAHGIAEDAGFVLDPLDLLHRPIQSRGHGLVHQRRLVSLDVLGVQP